MTQFTIVERVLSELLAHAREANPAECCGVLIGRGQHITSSQRSPNLAASPDTRYELDPAVFIRARREARDQGLDVLGFYHSHPHSDAAPSATDLAESMYPDLVYLIVGAAGEARLFRLRQDGFAEVVLVVTQLELVSE